MNNVRQEENQKDSLGSVTYRELLVKTILEEWGPKGVIEDMSHGTRPYSTEIYTLTKKWRVERERIPNLSQFLCTGGEQTYVAFQRQVDASSRFMNNFMTNPKQFTDEQLESARNAMIANNNQADDVNRAGGWGFDPTRKVNIIMQNSKALEQKKIDASTGLTKDLSSEQSQSSPSQMSI